jgi:hypothetical protein
VEVKSANEFLGEVKRAKDFLGSKKVQSKPKVSKFRNTK